MCLVLDSLWILPARGTEKCPPSLILAIHKQPSIFQEEEKVLVGIHLLSANSFFVRFGGDNIVGNTVNESELNLPKVT